MVNVDRLQRHSMSRWAWNPLKAFLENVEVLIGAERYEQLERATCERPPIYDRVRQCLYEANGDESKFIEAWRETSVVLHTSNFGNQQWVEREARRAKFKSHLHPKLREVVLENSNGLCAYCGEEASSIDHIVPRKQGGTNDRKNLVAACRTCNSRKGARTPIEWKQSLIDRQKVYDWQNRVLVNLESA